MRPYVNEVIPEQYVKRILKKLKGTIREMTIK